MPFNYDPAARFEVKEWDVEFRKSGDRQLMARIYQPQGKGPFPVVLDLHGGAWNRKDRFANVPMDQAVAKSGVLVVAVDLTLAPAGVYPASVQDGNYAVRWLKWKAPEWNGDASKFGVLGSSTGGYVAELLALRPNDPVYAAHRLTEAPQFDAKIDYMMARSPISDPFARFKQAEKMKRDHMMQNSRNYFDPWENIHVGNPQAILDRKEQQSLPPVLIMQGGLDDNVIPAIQEKFVNTYLAAGGECELHVYEGCEHEWVAQPGPSTDRAHEMVKGFVAKNLAR